MNTKNLKSYFTIACSIVPEEQLKTLFAQMGYDKEITADLCSVAFAENGSDFGIPFGNLVKDALETDIAKSYFKAAADRLGFTGKGSAGVNKTTGTTKEELAYKWCTFITDTLISGASTVSDVINATNGTYVNQAAASLAYAESERVKAQTRNNLILLAGGGILLVVIIIVVVMLAKR